MEFRRITLGRGPDPVPVGTPGQDRFLVHADDLVRGAIGAIVLVDTRRLAHCFPAVDYFENSGLPLVIALNGFDGNQPYNPDEVRGALPDRPRHASSSRRTPGTARMRSRR